MFGFSRIFLIYISFFRTSCFKKLIRIIKTELKLKDEDRRTLLSRRRTRGFRLVVGEVQDDPLLSDNICQPDLRGCYCWYYSNQFSMDCTNFEAELERDDDRFSQLIQKLDQYNVTQIERLTIRNGILFINYLIFFRKNGDF